jgi:hypothetical protein
MDGASDARITTAHKAGLIAALANTVNPVRWASTHLFPLDAIGTPLGFVKGLGWASATAKKCGKMRTTCSKTIYLKTVCRWTRKAASAAFPQECHRGRAMREVHEMAPTLPTSETGKLVYESWKLP